MTDGEDGCGTTRLGAPKVGVHFDHPDRTYAPQDSLTAAYEVEGVAVADIRAIERSVVWYTEGKGEEDLGVHHFDRLEGAAALRAALPAGSVSLRLPPSPLSYEGVVVKIRWCVRIRLFFTAGRDYVSEHVFDLGDVPPSRGTVERLA
ncbi:MAG: hypothetical protein EBS56_07925 [Planctomycetia bacterium]|nr:hypothetical protein [Planctomycetia bacterium]